ncbi:MAG: phosphatase PAP2 family protein [Candidatus Sungbacteria bacterium]|nr:phosphatase PAP2 family protein [Candidatus Sungbacteria bacterium]
MDNFLFASIYNFAFKEVWADTLIILFAAYWEYVVVAVILFYLWSPKFRKADLRTRAVHTALAVFSALLARFGVTSLIRNFYPRERPFAFEGLDSLISQNPLESSFPSGHATFFMALAVYFLLAGQKKMGYFLLVSAALIGAARVAAGVHWPSDILAGWAIGAAVSFVVFKVFSNVQH